MLSGEIFHNMEINPLEEMEIKDPFDTSVQLVYLINTRFIEPAVRLISLLR